MSKIAKLAGIVKSHSAGEIEGVDVDVQTANAILTVYNSMSAGTKEKYANDDINRMANFAWNALSK